MLSEFEVWMMAIKVGTIQNLEMDNGDFMRDQIIIWDDDFEGLNDMRI